MKKLALLVLAFVMAVMPVGSAVAIIDIRLDKYAENSIFFYDPDCDNYDTINTGGGDDDVKPDEGEVWEGTCTPLIGMRAEWLKKQIGAMRSVSLSNNLPWELIAAQAIKESGAGKAEACPYNPLGLTVGKSGGATCDGEFRTFASYEEAYQYYVNSIIPIKAIKGKYPNDPYSAIYYIQYGPTKHYASCSAADVANPEHPCYGKKAGDPTPGYVKDVSSIICGIQKWAESEGYPISSVTWRNYTGTSNPSKDSSDGRSGSNKVVDYCNPSRYDDDDNEEENDCEKKGTCDSYVFPLRGATKSNYMHGSALSPLPCNNLSQGGCHHDYFAMDLGLNTGTKTERDFPDLIGVFPDWYWKSVGVKVVAMAPGKIISYKPYGRATNGYRDRCASVQYETNDGRVFWLGHMSYDPKYKAGDTFRAGDVIGEVGPPPCAVGTQAHLHVDETIKNGSNGTVETVKLINYLYNQLP